MNERPLSKFLIALSVFFILFANFAFWISSNIYNSDNFNNNIINVFEKQEVRDAIAAGVVDRILEDNPTLRQILNSPAQSAISGLLGSSYLQPVIEKVAGRFQQYITTGQKEVSVDLAPINNLVTGIARVTGNTQQTPQIRNTELVILPANAFPKLNTWLKPITTAGPILGAAAIVILGLMIYRNPNRLNTLRLIGIFLSVGALINILMIPFVSSLINQYAPNANAAVVASEAFNTFARSYLYQLLLILLIGLILVFLQSLFNLFTKTKERK